jgi:fatty acid desaturase
MTDRHSSAAGRPCPAGRTDDIEQFLVHYEDTIDDRVAEIVEEVLGEQLRRYRRDVVLPVTVTLLAAAAVSLALMWWSPWTVPLVWAATSVICVSLPQTARIPRRS